MTRRVQRPGVRAGYDRWAATYDADANPLVALDRRHTLDHLRPASGERILDAGCGTGANLRGIVAAGARPFGLDFSLGMLRVARRSLPHVPLAQADLHHPLPLRHERFDAFLCALVSEHLESLQTLFAEAFAVVRRGGRLVFSAFHPEVARSGVEANFADGDVEYRLGALPHTVDDYLHHIDRAGFRALRWREYGVDATLFETVPKARKYLGAPLLLVVDAERPA